MPMSVKANGTPASNSRGSAKRAANVESSSSKSGDCPDAYEYAYCAPTASVEMSVSTKRETAITRDFRRLRVSWISQSGLAGNSQVRTTGLIAPEGAGSKLLVSAIIHWMHSASESKPGGLPRETVDRPSPELRIHSGYTPAEHLPGKLRIGEGAESEGLQFLAGLEAHRFSRRDAHFLAGARVAADAGLAGAHVEHAEAAQLDAFAFAKRTLHGLEDSFDSLFRLGSADAGLVYYGVYNIKLNHPSLLRFNGKLC